MILFFKEKGVDNVALAKNCYEYYEVGDWHDRNGVPIKNWKQKVLMNWIVKEREKQKKVPVVKLKSVDEILKAREGARNGTN
jgi:hypothetical protein